VLFSMSDVVADASVAGIFSTDPFWNETSTLAAVSAGAALTAYSFIGFDAVSTFAEEAIEPRKTIPRAIVLTAAVAGTIFVLVAYVVQLVHPGGVFENPESAALDVARTIACDFFAAVFLATVILAQFTAGIPIQAAGARLMYAMGRDGVLPRTFFAYVSPRFRTPVLNIVLTGAVGLVALFLSVSTSTSFINFGAFTAFAFVNISVIVLYLRQRHEVQRNPVSWILQPLVGLAVIVWLLLNLDAKALTAGAVWIVLGFLWMLYITRMFRREPPEMDQSVMEDERL